MKVGTTVLILLVAAVAGAGCGSSDGTDETSNLFIIKKGTIGSCLLNGGAERATSDEDLAFLSEAESDDEVAKVAFALDRSAGLLVNVWTATPEDGRPPSWTVWFAQPIEDERSPMDIVQADGADGYVVFVNRPTKAVRARTKACIEVQGGKKTVLPQGFKG